MKIWLRIRLFSFSWKVKGGAITKLHQITFYPTVIMNQKGPMKRKEKIIEKRKEIPTLLVPYLA